MLRADASELTALPGADTMPSPSLDHAALLEELKANIALPSESDEGFLSGAAKHYSHGSVQRQERRLLDAAARCLTAEEPGLRAFYLRETRHAVESLARDYGRVLLDGRNEDWETYATLGERERSRHSAQALERRNVKGEEAANALLAAIEVAADQALDRSTQLAFAVTGASVHERAGFGSHI
jgi:hypothetical protein